MQRSGNPMGYRSFSSRLYAGRNKIYFLETAAFSLEPAVSLTLWPAAIWMVSPVCGLRPVRAARSVRSTASQPGMVIFSPAATEVSKTSNSASSTELTAAWLVPALPATSATSSLRFLAIYVLLDGHDFWSLHTACVQTTVRKLTSLALQRRQIPRVFGVFWGKSRESTQIAGQIPPRADGLPPPPFSA